jgi:hypothetical protein
VAEVNFVQFRFNGIEAILRTHGERSLSRS